VIVSEKSMPWGEARAGAAPEEDRRAWVRYQADAETVCQPYSAGEDDLWWQARVRDVSAGGVGLLLSRRFEPGAILTIDLWAGAGDGSRSLLGRVRHATRHGTEWLVGCEFLWTLGDDELHALLP
jgi:hypothetical protein